MRLREVEFTRHLTAEVEKLWPLCAEDIILESELTLWFVLFSTELQTTEVLEKAKRGISLKAQIDRLAVVPRPSIDYRLQGTIPASVVLCTWGVRLLF